MKINKVIDRLKYILAMMEYVDVYIDENDYEVSVTPSSEKLEDIFAIKNAIEYLEGINQMRVEMGRLQDEIDMWEELHWGDDW